ncbi:hypothetical protein BGX38DRAFT_1265279 [Terfezia claveryi]|nr:hypothetical protein BGX38DRAFT_1265279 [Terfezia claveryi]
MSETDFSKSLVDPTEWGSSTAAESVWTPTHTEVPGKSNNGTPLSVLPGSRIAAVSYHDSQGRYLCVFWQDEKGIIRESLFLRDGKHWKLTRAIFVTDGAKMESPLTAIIWANGVEIATHHQSGLVAGQNRAGRDELWIRVFYQDQHLQLQELRFDSCHPRWVHGYKELPHALPGSVLAFGTHTNSTFLHLYYQKQDSQPAEIHYMPLWWLNPLNMWFHGGYRPDGHYPHRTAIAGIVREGHLRIFCHEGGGVISETIWAPLAWAPTTRLPIKFPNASHFVALEWMEPDVREGWQQHIVGINTVDGAIWDYITGSEKVGPQISLFNMAYDNIGDFCTSS